jgi:hypothetical protein
VPRVVGSRTCGVSFILRSDFLFQFAVVMSGNAYTLEPRVNPPPANHLEPLNHRCPGSPNGQTPGEDVPCSDRFMPESPRKEEWSRSSSLSAVKQLHGGLILVDSDDERPSRSLVSHWPMLRLCK